jgi:hypothetical protein
MNDERNEIARRVEEFRAMQERLAREREARMDRETARTRELLKAMRERFKSGARDDLA